MSKTKTKQGSFSSAGFRGAVMPSQNCALSLLSKLRSLSLKINFLWYLHSPFIQVCGLPACSAAFHPYKHSRALLLSNAGSSQEPPLTFKPQTSRSVRARASRAPIGALHFKTGGGGAV